MDLCLTKNVFGRVYANGLCMIPGLFRGYRRRLYRYSFSLFYFENLKKSYFYFSVGNNRRRLLLELIECGTENIGTFTCVEFPEEWEANRNVLIIAFEENQTAGIWRCCGILMGKSGGR